MIRSSRENDFATKQEDGIDDGKIPKGHANSRPWLGLKDPRIVRVSRSFGGKDRHSKVRTIRGLRDRRVRLSVQTAIQLYDLQDRLGLNQPSKVVDWLLNAAQKEIDELPPLQMPPEILSQYPQSVVVPHEAAPSQVPSGSLFSASIDQVRRGAIYPCSNSKGKSVDAIVVEDQITLPKYSNWNSNAPSRIKCNEVGREQGIEKFNWFKGNEQENKDAFEISSVPPVSTCVPFPLYNYSSIPSFSHLNLPPMACISNPVGHGSSPQIEDSQHNSNSMSISSLLSLPLGAQLPFPSHDNVSLDSNLKQIYFQMLRSSSQNLLPTSTSLHAASPTMRPNNHHFQINHDGQSNALRKDSAASSSFLGPNSSSFI